VFDYGVPEVMKFRDGKAGAFTMQFDDSMETQAAVAVPQMNARGLVGTFYINPDTDRYRATRDTWEVVCPRSGHELANHTMRHEGAKDYAEAEREIGECSRLIWGLYPGRSKLRPFARGGATTWNVSDEQMHELMARYFLFRRNGGQPIGDEFGTGDDPAALAREAIEGAKWVPVHFHGIGGQWLSVNEKAFIALLDYVAANRDRLWIATAGAAHKYQQEYQAVSAATLTDAGKTGFMATVECDEARVNTFGAPFADLYDEPLTVRTRVPASWRRIRVEQAGKASEYETARPAALDAGAGLARLAYYDVRPNAADAVVSVVERD